MSRIKGQNDSLTESYNLVKLLQDRLDNKSIMKAVKLSESTVKRMKVSKTFQEYRDLVTSYNNDHKKQPKTVVFKKEEVVKGVNPFVTKTNDISKIGEITTMSLLNAILAELKTLNNKVESVGIVKKSLFGGRF